MSLRRLLTALLLLVLVGSHAGVLAAAVSAPDADAAPETDAGDRVPVSPFYDAATLRDIARFTPDIDDVADIPAAVRLHVCRARWCDLTAGVCVPASQPPLSTALRGPPRQH
jgi:hypothetical protein